MEASLTPLSEPEQLPVRKPKRLSWKIGNAILLAVFGVAIWRNLPQGKQQEGLAQSSKTAHNAQSIPVTVQSVTLTDSPQSLEVTGTVQSEWDASLASKVLGRVQSVLAKEGDQVRRGQTLVLLEAQDLDASLLQANANLRAANVGYDNARVAARMEASLSTAHIAEAQAKVSQSEAALQAATSRLQLVQAGPRRQERQQAVLAVSQAKSNLTLAESSLKRMTFLYKEGAISAQQYDQYQSQFEIARAQFETAQQGQSIADEGSRAEDIRAAQQAVRQAQAAIAEANAGLKSAQASAMLREVRKQEIQGTQAQIGQSKASVQLAKVTRQYAAITSPFDGVVTKRLADPGVMASPGLPLLNIQGGTLRLEAVVPESVLRSIKTGSIVPVHFDALQHRALVGRVVEVAPKGDAGSHTFVVKIDLPRTSGASAGMFGRARFTTGSEKHLLVPASAVFEREGLHYLYVVDASHTARLRMVTVSDPVGERFPVLSGLNSDERIVTTGRERITDGSLVTEGSR